MLRISRTVRRFVADPQVETAIDHYTAEHYGEIGEWQHAAPKSGDSDYEAIVRGLRDAEGVQLFRPVREEGRAVASLETCNG